MVFQASLVQRGLDHLLSLLRYRGRVLDLAHGASYSWPESSEDCQDRGSQDKSNSVV